MRSVPSPGVLLVERMSHTAPTEQSWARSPRLTEFARLKEAVLRMEKSSREQLELEAETQRVFDFMRAEIGRIKQSIAALSGVVDEELASVRSDMGVLREEVARLIESARAENSSTASFLAESKEREKRNAEWVQQSFAQAREQVAQLERDLSDSKAQLLEAGGSQAATISELSSNLAEVAASTRELKEQVRANSEAMSSNRAGYIDAAGQNRQRLEREARLAEEVTRTRTRTRTRTLARTRTWYASGAASAARCSRALNGKRSVHPPEYQSSDTQSMPASSSGRITRRHSRQEKSAPWRKRASGRSDSEACEGSGRRNVVRTEARSSGVSSSTSTHDILPSAHCAAGSEMTPPSRGVFGVKARADADMLTQARVGGTARSAAAHDQRHTKDTLIARILLPRRRRGVRGRTSFGRERTLSSSLV